MLKSRKELIELIEFGYDIKEIINLWDPLNLLYISPEDEYETEIRIIRNLVVNNKNINKKILSQKIRKIFKNSFSYEYNPKKDIEENVASKIIEKSKKYKLSNTVSVSSDYDIENVIWQDNKNIDVKEIILGIIIFSAIPLIITFYILYLILLNFIYE